MCVLRKLGLTQKDCELLERLGLKMQKEVQSSHQTTHTTQAEHPVTQSVGESCLKVLCSY